MLRTGRSHAPEGRLSLRFDAALSNDAGSQLPGTLASPRTGLAPAGCPELDARLHLLHPLSSRISARKSHDSLVADTMNDPAALR
jgi:hypothetical protein